MWEYTKEDFLNSSVPYQEILSIEDPFVREQTTTQMQEYAKSVKVTNFKALLNRYREAVNRAAGVRVLDNATCFTGQPMELDSGKWIADDSGVYQETEKGYLYACPHPILPVEKLVNVDTGEEKLRLAYRKGSSPWRSTIVEKRVLSSASKVTDLASSGISVTSDNAKTFIRYIFEIEALNYDTLPERKTVGRLGHISGEGFSPYFEGLLFDGDANFRSLFEAVSSSGDFETWQETAQWARRSSITAKLLLAASFASPLLEVLGALPFFVHLWGVDSGTGKTVALMLAASVWGNPAIGWYIKTFNSTVVGCEKTAAFLNNLPLCLDELQLSKDSHGRSNFDVYQLTEGVGRTRGNRGGGVDLTPTWRNTILTTGESPLNGASAGAGAVNRVINIECRTGDPAVPAGCGMWLSNQLKKHYGHAGRRFVERLYAGETNLDEVRSIYENLFKLLSERDTTEKQAMAAAAIMTADHLMCSWVFDGQEQPITMDEMSQFLTSKASVSLGQRAYDFLLDWVAANRPKFELEANASELWGRIETGYICILKNQFDHVLSDEGYDPKAVLSWLNTEGKLARKSADKTHPNCLTYRTRINGIPRPTICISADILPAHYDLDDGCSSAV